jgi:hypothetical protein
MARQITLSQLRAHLTVCELACYFKTESTEMVAFCFGISVNTVFSNAIIDGWHSYFRNKLPDFRNQ